MLVDCAFFGLDGVSSFILPQILAFWNERKDQELCTAMSSLLGGHFETTITGWDLDLCWVSLDLVLD